MSIPASVLGNSTGSSDRSKSPAAATTARASRLILVAGCVATVALAASIGTPSESSSADPQLALLLRGMAVLKALFVAAAIGAASWRLGRPIGPRMIASYIASLWLMTGATVLIWRLALIPAAAIVFHLGLLGFLVAALRDHRRAPRLAPAGSAPRQQG